MGWLFCCQNWYYLLLILFRPALLKIFNIQSFLLSEGLFSIASRTFFEVYFLRSLSITEWLYWPDLENTKWAWLLIKYQACRFRPLFCWQYLILSINISLYVGLVKTSTHDTVTKLTKLIAPWSKNWYLVLMPS